MPLKIIIIGAGEVGFHIARRLSSENKDVVVLDRSAQALRRVIENLDVKTIEGSGSSPSVLRDAGIAGTDILLAVTDSDETNFIACTVAHALHPGLIKLARIRNEEYVSFLEDILGIGKVINPEDEVVKSVVQIMTVPGAVDVNEFADGRIKLIGVRVEEGPLIGLRLMDMRAAAQGLRFIIAAIVRKEQLIIPSGTDSVQQGDLVYFVCEDERLYDVLALLGMQARPAREVLVIGGGNIGLKIARTLEGKGYHVKLVDRDPERCAVLAQQLEKTLVLQGDGTDQDLLEEENIRHMDVVVTVTGDEETNILCSLLAKSLGAGRTITRINKFAYFPLVAAIGIEHTVSPRQSAVNSILRYMRRGKVLTSAAIKGEEAEALEAIALEHSDVAGKSLAELKLPKGALVLSIQREGAIIFPGGDTVIEPQDRILILSTRKNIERVERALMVKLEYF
jgi:trk system potassium uptake protein TrkA